MASKQTLRQTGKPLRKHERTEELKRKGEIKVGRHGSEEAGERRAIEKEVGKEVSEKGKEKS